MEKVSVFISCSAGELFSIHQDFSRRPEWESGLRAIRLIGPEEQPRVGLTTCIRLWTGISIEAEYTAFEPPRLLAVEMVKGPKFLKSFAATWFFERAPAGTIARIEFEWESRPRLLKAALAPVVRWQMMHRLNRLKAYVENRPRQLPQPGRL